MTKEILALVIAVVPVAAQEPVATQQKEPSPIYRVTVVERTTKAVNYRYRSEATLIDFKGTVLMPQAKGSARVESKQGRTEIDAGFQNILPPSRFGREYLTYVLWALTPDGRPHNLGEVVPGTSDKSRMQVTTDLQAFAMIVTAEPYAAVRQPSDVVVLENEVRPDTVGNIQPVEARYELLPRGQYAWHPNGTEPPVNTPKVSMKKYEELSQIYQAQNAIGAARAAGAAQYAPNTLAKAEQLLTTARQFEQNKTGDSSRVIQDAREAAQTAEDARAISERRKQEEKLAATASQVTAAQQAQAAAEAEAHRARSEAEAARAQADAERVARERAEAEAANARERAVQTQTAVPPPPPRRTPEPAQKPELRIRLLEQLNAPVATRDTPRGLVATLPDNGFSGTTLRAATADQIAQIAAIVAAHPGLRVEVEGHSDKADSQAMTAQRANAVRDVLIAHGLPPGAISARGLGNSRPLASNATEAGREENRRVEITISGEPIGNVPFWDKTYTLGSR